MIFDFFRKRRVQAEGGADAMDMAYRLVFGSEGGRVVLADLVERGHLYGPSYVPGDTHETALREGERNMVLYILSRVQLPGEREKLTEEVIENGR